MSTELVLHKNCGDVVAKNPTALLFDPEAFEQMQRVAKVMAASSFLPDHLMLGKNKAKLADHQIVANCVLVVNQAMRWKFDPFAVAAESYVVANKLGFQGKLVAAVVNARARLEGRLSYEFHGAEKSGERTVTVRGKFADEDFDRVITLSVAQARTDNKMWAQDPDQKLCYSGVTKWARRHCPEIMLGVLTDDDLERMAHDDAIQRVAPSKSLDELTARLTSEPLEAPSEEEFNQALEADAAERKEGELFDKSQSYAESGM